MFTHHEEDNVHEESVDSSEQIAHEPDEEMGDLTGAQSKIKKLREELKEAHTKRDEYLDGWQRCKADSINARKEWVAQADRAYSRGVESVVGEIIPVLDSFDMAATSEAWESVGDGWRSGMESIRNQLLDILARNGIERYGKVGDTYDHSIHEAVQEAHEAAGESGEIIRVLRYGYRTKEKTLRPAQVIVKR